MKKQQGQPINSDEYQADEADQVRPVKIDDIVFAAREYSEVEKVEIAHELACIERDGKPSKPICLANGARLSFKSRFSLVSGELRLEAGRRARLQEISALVLPDGADAKAVGRLASRLDDAPHPIFAARALAQFKAEAKCSDNDLIKLFMPGKSRATVNNMFALTRLPDDWQTKIMALRKVPPKSLLIGLVRVEDDERRRALFECLLDGNLTIPMLRGNDTPAETEAATGAPSSVVTEAETTATAVADDEQPEPTAARASDGKDEARLSAVRAGVREHLRALDTLVHKVRPAPDKAASAEWDELLRLVDDIRNRLRSVARFARGASKEQMAT